VPELFRPRFQALSPDRSRFKNRRFLVPAFLLAVSTGLLWHAIPIILIVSLVYGGTRHELLRPILHNAFRTVVWITGFMLLIAAVLLVISRFV
jgi:hypothetical protein